MLVGLATSSSGCAATAVHDARAVRPARAQCAFGAETAALAAWCAEVNFGGEGLMAVARAVNQAVLARAAAPLACTEHVAEARRRLADYPDYRVAELYSCDADPPLEDGRPVCHVSLLATDRSGRQVVLDNGHVLEPAATGGVAAYAQFAARVSRVWLGGAADALAVSAQGPRR